MNEVATDYNAGFTSALARMYREFGGTPLSSFPPPDNPKDDDEIYVQAALNATGTNFTEIKAFIINKSGWPARVTDRLTMRYFFTLESGVTPSQITIATNYNQCNGASGPTLYTGNIYYVTIDCVGVKIYPGGQSAYRKEVQFRIASSGAWDPTNDWSYEGIATPAGATPVKVNHITLYENGVLIWVVEPGGVTTPIATSTATRTPTRTNTPAGPTATPTHTPTRTNTPVAPTATRTNTPVVPTATPTSPAGPACSVRYVIQNDWGSGATVNATIRNNAATAINGWTLAWVFPGNQQIGQMWSATYTQSGQNVSASNLSWNATIPANGGTVTFGFNLTYSGVNAAPTSFTLNGSACGTY